MNVKPSISSIESFEVAGAIRTAAHFGEGCNVGVTAFAARPVGEI